MKWSDESKLVDDLILLSFCVLLITALLGMVVAVTLSAKKHFDYEISATSTAAQPMELLDPPVRNIRQ